MNTTLKQTGQKWLNWASQHPKKFFIYSMVFLSVSFIGSLIQGIFFPSDNAFKIKPPILYSKSKMVQNTAANNDKEMEKIVNELKLLKMKSDRKELKKEELKQQQVELWRRTLQICTRLFHTSTSYKKLHAIETAKFKKEREEKTLQIGFTIE